VSEGKPDALPEQTGPVFSYPVYLDLHGRAVLVVGAGPVAARKTAGLIAAGAAVTVVAPEISGDVRALDPPPVAILVRGYDRSLLDELRPWLVITATDGAEVNAQVARDAEAAGIWVNSADDPVNCGFILPAIHRQGDVTVAVSTGGAAPALAQYVRDRVGELIGPAYARAAVALRRRRGEFHARGDTTEGRDWQSDIETALRDAD
jgi:siroheme synthase-like protein